jgi:hypothetical protein
MNRVQISHTQLKYRLQLKTSLNKFWRELTSAKGLTTAQQNVLVLDSCCFAHIIFKEFNRVIALMLKRVANHTPETAIANRRKKQKGEDLNTSSNESRETISPLLKTIGKTSGMYFLRDFCRTDCTLH